MPVVSTADPDWQEGSRSRSLGAMVSEFVPLLGDGGALWRNGAMSPDPVIFTMSAVTREIMFAGVSSSRGVPITSAEQHQVDVAEAIEIGRSAPEKFEVEADYNLTRFADAIEHMERDNATGRSCSAQIHSSKLLD